jgi:tetratricopeptide (TPR) repeat protein
MIQKFTLGALILFVAVYLCQPTAYALSTSERWKALNGTADALYQAGEYQKSQKVWQQALLEAKKLGASSRELATTYSNLAMVETSLGHPESALELHRKAVAMLQTITGSESEATAAALVNEAECLRDLKRYSEAEPLYKTALPIIEKGGDEHDALLTLNNLALCYHKAGKLKEAEEAFEKARERAESAQGKQDQLLAVICTNMGSLYENEKNFSEAEKSWQRALSIQKTAQRPNVFETAVTMNNLALLYDSEKKTEEADKLFKESLELVRNNLGTGSGAYQTVFVNYLATLIQGGRRSEADSLVRYAAAHNPGTLAEAVHRMDKDPKWAEQKLKSLDFASAKVYLAYLYFTRQVAVSNTSKKVDQLMNDAIAQMPDTGWNPSASEARTCHYTNLASLLEHLRLITEYEGLGIAAPESMFKRYPAEAFDAFGPRWGCTRDACLNIEPKDEISSIPAIAGFIQILHDMYGDPYLPGTIRFCYYRKQALAVIEASIAPRVYLSTAKVKQDPDSRNPFTTARFLEFWSNQELWNKMKYREWSHARKQAAGALAKHYAQHFGYSASKAQKCAIAAIDAINEANFPCYPIEEPGKIISSNVYKTFHRNGLTLSEMEHALHGRKLSKDELREALRLAILNNGSIDVIKWILGQKPPLTGDLEPALFTAVGRPDVVGLLIKSGANVNEANELGKTALIQACQFNSLESVKRLLAAGAKIRVSMSEKVGPFDHKDKYATDYNYRIGGRTPLMYAVSFSSYPVIRCLIDHGADKKVVDTNKDAAKDYLADNKLLSKAQRDSLTRALR